MNNKFFLFALLFSLLGFLTSTLVAEEGTDPYHHLKYASSAEGITPLKPGDRVPESVSLWSSDQKLVPLKKIIEKKPTVLIFYRGGWCPYCNTHLAELGQVQEDLVNLGYQIVAVSPDRPEKLRETKTKKQLPYELYSDSSMYLSTAFGLAFKLEDALVEKYKKEYGIDIEADSGETHHLLPVPAVYLIDTGGEIRFVYTNPDYKTRLKPDEIIAAAKSLQP